MNLLSITVAAFKVYKCIHYWTDLRTGDKKYVSQSQFQAPPYFLLLDIRLWII